MVGRKREGRAVGEGDFRLRWEKYLLALLIRRIHEREKLKAEKSKLIGQKSCSPELSLPSEEGRGKGRIKRGSVCGVGSREQRCSHPTTSVFPVK